MVTKNAPKRGLRARVDRKKMRQSKGFCPTCNEHRCCRSNETCTSCVQSCNFRYILSIASQPKTTNLNEP